MEKPAVVLDNGSYITKAGFACDNHPVCMFRTVVGRPANLQSRYGKEYYDVIVGDPAIDNEDLDLNSPVQTGRIVHWDNMQRVWHHCYYRELKVAPEDRGVMLALNANTPMADKIKCCEIFFEVLNAPSICIQSQNVLAMYGSGYTTGISIDLGYDSVDISPIYEGGNIKYAHMTTHLAVKDIHANIQTQLNARGVTLTKTDIEEIKDRVYVTTNTAMSRNDHKRIYKLPSGEEIDVGQEAFMTGELLFQPDLVMGEETSFLGLQDAVFTACLKCDPSLQDMMYTAVVPFGGLATVPGLNDRLSIELHRLRGKSVNVVSSMEPYTVSWLGGACFAGIEGAKILWVTKKQFEDHGARIVMNKFVQF